MRSIVFSIHQDVGFLIFIVIYLCQLFICFPLTHNLFDSFDFVVSWIKVTMRTRKCKKHIDDPTIPIPKSTRFDHINCLKQSSQASWHHLPLLRPFFLEIISSTMNRRPQSFRPTCQWDGCWQKCCGRLWWIMEWTSMQELKLHRSIWWNRVAYTWKDYRNTNWCNTQQLRFFHRQWFR